MAAEEGLAPDWLNDAVKAFLPGEDSAATVVLERRGLTVSIASPRYLFVMKAIAAREADEEDLRTLYRTEWVRVGNRSARRRGARLSNPTPAPAVQHLVEGSPPTCCGDRVRTLLAPSTADAG